MSGGNCRSANLAQMDAAWRRFVACDPEFSALEREKVEIYRRHVERQSARQKRAQRLRAWQDKIANAAAAVFIELLTVSALIALFCLA